MGLRDNKQTRVLLHQFFADLFWRFGMTSSGRQSGNGVRAIIIALGDAWDSLAAALHDSRRIGR